MPKHMTPLEDIEIISPAAQQRLMALEERQARELVRLENLESIARLMDAQFKIPGLPIPIGVDAIVGLIPGIGDTISLGVAGSIVYGSKRLGVDPRNMGRMGYNIFVDWLIGLVPVVGDLFDIGWRGNMKNVTIAREALEEKWAREREAALYLEDGDD